MKYRSVRRFLKVGAESLVTVEPLEVTDVTVQQIGALALVRPAKSGQFILTVYYMHNSCATSGRDSLSVGVPVIEHTPKAHLGEPSS